MTKPILKVLVVCMLDSIHTARWLKQFSNQNIEFHLFASTPNRRVHPELSKLINGSSDQTSNFILHFGTKYKSLVLWFIDILMRNYLRGFLISKIIKNYRITVVHAIELNHAGYLVLTANKFNPLKNVKVIVTNWGSDIYWFSRFNRHKKKLIKLLQISDDYSAECRRDIELAANLGFKGRHKDVYPNAGGFDLSQILIDSQTPSERNIILVKGYESFVGRASIALEALNLLAKNVSRYEIHIYSANIKTIRRAKRLSQEKNLKIITYPKKSLSHQQLLDLFRKSRIYLGVSLSDGISTSFLEALITGAFPIQTNTSCADEWITSGKSGLLIDPTVESASQALLQALADDDLVNNAALINRQISLEKLNHETISKKIINFYN